MVAHYGTSISRGTSQLVPRPAPHLPRRFSPRECARLMGFPEWFELSQLAEGESPAWLRAHYKMFGNSVCPPIVAALAGDMLDHAQLPWCSDPAWGRLGRSAALRLALHSLPATSRQKLLQVLHASWADSSK